MDLIFKVGSASGPLFWAFGENDAHRWAIIRKQTNCLNQSDEDRNHLSRATSHGVIIRRHVNNGGTGILPVRAGKMPALPNSNAGHARKPKKGSMNRPLEDSLKTPRSPRKAVTFAWGLKLRVLGAFVVQTFCFFWQNIRRKSLIRHFDEKVSASARQVSFHNMLFFSW